MDYLEPASYPDVARIVRERDPRSIAIGDFDNGRMIEALGVAVPGWGEHGVELGIGQIAVFTDNGLEYLDRPQATEWHVIK